MYMSQHRFTPVPEKFDQWVPYNWNYMTLTARAPGAVLSRILRICEEPDSFFAVGLWTGHEAAAQWSASPQSALGAKPSADQGLYEGYPMEWSRWNLIDFAQGPAAGIEMEAPDVVIRHIEWELASDLASDQETLAAVALSLLARHPGFVSGETYRGHRADKLLMIHTYKTGEDWPFSGSDLPAEFALLGDSPRVQDIIAKTGKPRGQDCSAFQVVWGPEASTLSASYAA